MNESVSAVKSIMDAINRTKQTQSELNDIIHTGETIMDRVGSSPLPETKSAISAISAMEKEPPPQNITEELQRIATENTKLCGKLGSLIQRMDRTF
jgi:hypothetical protein